MKIAIPVVSFLILFFSLTAFSQVDINAERISFIKAQFLEINKNIASYKKVTKEAAAQSSEGNQIIGYIDNGKVKKITASYYGETGKNVEEYYFFYDALSFYYSQNSHYNLPINATFPSGNVKKIRVEEQRIYFSDSGMVIKYLTKPDTKSQDNELKKISDEVLSDAKRLIKLVGK